MLRGNYLATVDEKGRVKIPADFLAELRKSGTKFYVTSDTGEYARVYTMKAWQEIERKLAKLSLTTAPSRNFWRAPTITVKWSRWMGRGAF